MKINALLCLILISAITTSNSSCHYTCFSCSSSQYSACTSCPNKNPLTFTVVDLPPPQGTCADITTNNANAVGMILFLTILVSTPMFPTQQLIHLALSLQSLGIFYLVEAYWPPVVDYLFSALTYLMIFTKISFSYKQDNYNSYPLICKGRLFFEQFNLLPNIGMVGIVNASLILLLIIISVFKAARKRCIKERVNFLPDWVLDKLTLAIGTAFLLLIQQSTAVIYFSLTYGNYSASSVVVPLFYFIILILFTINQFFYPFPYFRTKFVQVNTIIGKCMLPLFLLFPTNANFIVFVFAMSIWVIDIIATNKNRNIGSFNRLLVYKIVGIICLCMVTVCFTVEQVVGNETLTVAFGYVSAIGICSMFYLLGMEIVFQTYKVYCEGQEKTKEIAGFQEQEREITLQNIVAGQNRALSQLNVHILHLNLEQSNAIPSQHLFQENIQPNFIPTSADPYIQSSSLQPVDTASLREAECVEIRPNLDPQVEETQENIFGITKKSKFISSVELTAKQEFNPDEQMVNKISGEEPMESINVNQLPITSNNKQKFRKKSKKRVKPQQ